MSLRNDLENRIRGLALEGVDIVFCKDPYIYKRLAQMHIPGITKEIKLMLVNDLDDLKALSHQDMRALGWVREEKITVKEAVKALDRKGFDVEMPDD